MSVRAAGAATATGSSVGRALSSLLRRAFSSALAWDGLIGVLCALWALYFIRSFTPGRVNVDIANQYEQAIGRIPVTDWHPPIMSTVWRVLIDLTGEQGSLLALQVGLIALACWILGVLVHRLGAPKWVSLLGPAVMLTPWTLSQMTTLWKDTQMAAAMFAAVMLLAIVRLVPKTWVLWVPAFALLVYAIALRKNTIFAMIPIAVYVGWCFVIMLRLRRARFDEINAERTVGGQRDGVPATSATSLVQETASVQAAARPSPQMRRSRWRTIVASASVAVVVLVILGAGVKVTDTVINSRVDVQPTGQISQILLDDVMFSVPNDELMESNAPTPLKQKISGARGKCLEMGEIWDAYWNCYGRGETGKAFTPIAYQDELKDLWLRHVITHPLRYAEYRAAVFSYYFFSSRLEYWPAGWHGDADAAGLERGDTKADFIFRPYVEDFALAIFPMLFKPWFWTLLAAGLLVTAFRWRTRATDAAVRDSGVIPEITMLSASALFYIVGYFPIVPANHFRYTYWPALAVTVGLVLALAMWSAGRSSGTPRRRLSGSPEAARLE